MTQRSAQRRGHTSIAYLVAAALLLAGLFAYNVRVGYFLGDDSYISFRYAAHLADGRGLVWNDGERVEGYTNFLWVLLMAGVLRAGASPEILSNAIGIASGAGVLIALLRAGREEGWDDPLTWVAPFALASSRSFTAWSSGGLETMFFTLLVFLSYLAFLGERRRRAAYPLGSSLLLALATLTRPEGALFAGVAGVGFLYDIIGRRRRPGAGLCWAAPYGLIVGAHLLWRFSYYGAWLPNSFYAKVPGAWWEQGFRYLALFARDYHLLWFAPLIVAAFVLRRGPRLYLAGGATLAYLVYVAYVGGDRFEFRFLVVVMPWLYLMIVEGLRGLVALRPRLRPLALFLALALVAATAGGGRGDEVDDVRDGVAGLGTIRDYADQRAEEGRFLRELIDAGRLPPDLVICVGGAGALPYYTDWPTIDRRGINDAMIARLPLEKRGEVAHERDAPYDYLQRRGVVIFDVFNQVVYDEDLLQGPRWLAHEGVDLPLRAVRADGRFLIFATLVPDDVFRRRFAGLEIVD